MEERKGREKSGGQLSVIILILLICSTEEVYILAAIFSKSHGARYINFCISGWLCPQLPSNKTGRKQTFPVIFAAVVAIKKCFCVLEMNFDSRNKVVYRDAGSETSRSREFVLRLIFSGVCFCRLGRPCVIQKWWNMLLIFLPLSWNQGKPQVNVTHFPAEGLIKEWI